MLPPTSRKFVLAQLRTQAAEGAPPGFGKSLSNTIRENCQQCAVTAKQLRHQGRSRLPSDGVEGGLPKMGSNSLPVTTDNGLGCCSNLQVVQCSYRGAADGQDKPLFAKRSCDCKPVAAGGGEKKENQKMCKRTALMLKRIHGVAGTYEGRKNRCG